MEIPNYDSDGDGEKKFKQLFQYMPRDASRMLICGNSGSEKTNLLYHMLMKPLIHTLRSDISLRKKSRARKVSKIDEEDE